MPDKHKRYPKIHIRSKNELAKHLSDRHFSKEQAIALINDVLQNYESYWRDHPTESQPLKGKWVRDASMTNLGKLLKKVDAQVLKPHDSLVPNFIFGGVGGLNHKAAVQHLLGARRKRVLLKLDISKFFERIKRERVQSLFLHKTGCGRKGAALLANLCCVPYGPKEHPEKYQTIARGFATSPRLAIWCNLDTFLKLDRLIKKELSGKDPRIAIYVDDIGVTASRITKEDMIRLYPKIKDILEEDHNQKLPINEAKTRIIYHSGETYDIRGGFIGKWGFEHLGLQMNRNSLTLGTKTRWKLTNQTLQHKSAHGRDFDLKRRRKSILSYKQYIER